MEQEKNLANQESDSPASSVSIESAHTKTETTNQRKQTKKEVWSFLRTTLFTFLLFAFLLKVIFLFGYVPSGSMEPILPTDSYIFGSRFSYWFGGPARGDVIIFIRSSEQQPRHYTKRVVGLPGDVVEIKEGKTYLNGTYYPEPWLAEAPQSLSFGPYTVPQDSYFCMGDNRNHSTDCRYWSPSYILKKDLKAKALFCFSFENGFHWLA